MIQTESLPQQTEIETLVSRYQRVRQASLELVARAGFRVEQVWTDPRQHFSVQYLVRERAVTPFEA